MARSKAPIAGSHLRYLGHSKDSLWSIDLFPCESLTLESYWVMAVMDPWSRRAIGFGINRGDAEGITRKFSLLFEQNPASIKDYDWKLHCRGLFQTPVPA